MIFGIVYVVFGKEASKKSEVKESLSCYTCGLEEIDPELDQEGSYGDERSKGYKTEKNLKMYNHTCDIADELGMGDNWVRKCPPGVKSCFWAEGRYSKQTPVFRGCADAQYAFDTGCNRELEAVQIIQGKRSVDVEILLCFCNEENCNTSLSGAQEIKLESKYYFGLLSCLLVH